MIKVFELSEEDKPKNLEDLLNELNEQTTQVLSALNSVIINMGQIRDGLKSSMSTINELLRLLIQKQPIAAVEKPSPSALPKPSKEEVSAPTPVPAKPVASQPETSAELPPTAPKEVERPTPPPAQTPPSPAPQPPPPAAPVEAPVTEAAVTNQRNILIEHELDALKQLAQSGTVSGKTIAEKILDTRDRIQQQLPYSPVYHEMLMMSQKMKSFGDGTPDSNSILELITKIEDWRKRLIK